ncbi:hypothetical protein F5I97DRAFT_1803319 [Phlebopus sp. FC_14]|nr:hypothetical protein F5I97DRAFT_1803319 [Phlebopus sp. FC_14]
MRRWVPPKRSKDRPSSSATTKTATPRNTFPVLRGPHPGLLDFSQPSRLFRFPGSTLTFASFDPQTALVTDVEPEIRKLNINFSSSNLPPPKRVVIETTAKGVSFWRFVPRAHLEEGVQDEGIWPRLIDVCGEHFTCYQEQWEIYKLDPEYKCVVYPGSRLSTITKVDSDRSNAHVSVPPGCKRTRTISPESSELAPQKKARPRHSNGVVDDHDEEELESADDEEEVEQMIVDDEAPRMPKPRCDHKNNHTSRERMKKERFRRWEQNKLAQEKLSQKPPIAAETSFSMHVDSVDNFASQDTSVLIDNFAKRKGWRIISVFDEAIPTNGNDQKRTRTVSPTAIRSAMNQMHSQHQKRKRDRMRQRDQLRQRQREEILIDALRFAFVPSGEPYFQEHKGDDNDDFLDPDAVRAAEVAESIRKLRELDRDKPLWEEERRKREARERAEEQERLAKQRRRAEAEKKRREQEEAERQRQQAQAAAEQRAREEEQRQREMRQRKQRQRWESGPWTSGRALERYKTLSEEFDSAKFCAEVPITFYDIPWPVLHSPSRLTVEDVDWSSVEAFFSTVRSHMRLQDYKTLVEKSHRRFHPDRWRARKVWTAVVDEVERGFLEVAANTVAQALTPIWREVKGQ